MIQFTPEYLKQRIYACWLGKNIGGTLGTPYEGLQQLNDIHGFNSKAGEPLPNDDLDLQLAWLRAVNDYGPDAITSKLLGEYWLSWVTPNWNEYGVCKANMRDGVLPPMSGEVNNEEWKHSNGAWIRTEVWACMYPGVPEKAIRMAFEDASVDHGFGEGTYAAIFVAAMESAAFVIRDTNALLDIGLSKIPENCRVARSVNIVREAHRNGVSWKECREALVRDSADLGWFQAPANIGFVVLGLLYGAGDFKQSLIYAINCGDDTDCTGATLGSLLGVMGGMEVIPEDWRAYIGDEIKTICLTNGHGPFPKDCTELTECIMNLLPVTLRPDHQKIFAHQLETCPCLGAETILDARAEDFYGREFVEKIGARKAHSYTVEGIYADALIEFDSVPEIRPNETLTGSITMLPHTLPEQKHYRLNFYAPAGWTVECKKNLFTPAAHSKFTQHAATEFAITAPETVEAVNRLVLEITSPGRANPILVPIQIMG